MQPKNPNTLRRLAKAASKKIWLMNGNFSGETNWVREGLTSAGHNKG